MLWASFLGVWGGGPASFLGVEMPMSQLTGWRDSLLAGLGTFVRSLLAVRASIYFGPVSPGPLVYTSLCQGPCLDYCCIILNSEIENVSIQFVLFKIVLIILGSVPWNSGWLLISAEKAAWGSERDCLESIGQLESVAILTIFCLSVHELGLSLHLFRS